MPVCFICFKPIQPLSSNVQCSTCILFRHKSCVSDPAIAFVCPGCGEYWKPTDNGKVKHKTESVKSIITIYIEFMLQNWKRNYEYSHV